MSTASESPDRDTQRAAAPGVPFIEFRGGKAMSALPILFFIAWAIFQSGVLGIGDTAGLIVGMLVGLILGMLFVRDDWTATRMPYSRAWRSVSPSRPSSPGCGPACSPPRCRWAASSTGWAGSRPSRVSGRRSFPP
jgi:hypothetical protein